MVPLVLASSSSIRAAMLRNAGLAPLLDPARLDEDQIRSALIAEDASPRDIADALAEAKALRVAARHPDAAVIGSDQVLEFDGTAWTKPETPDQAHAQLMALRGQTHRLLSAAVLVQDGRPVWRHVGVARLTMRDFSESWLDGYVSRNWPAIGDCVGAYQLEAEGIRLFSRIEGDYFTILGLPLLELLNILTLRQVIAA